MKTRRKTDIQYPRNGFRAAREIDRHAMVALQFCREENKSRVFQNVLEKVHVCFCLSGLAKLVTDIFSKRALRTTCLCPPLWPLQNSLRIPYVCLSYLFKTGCGYRMFFFLRLFEITRIVYHVLCPRYRSQSLQGGSMFSVLGVGLKTCLARLYILCPQRQPQNLPQEGPCSVSSVLVSV